MSATERTWERRIPLVSLSAREASALLHELVARAVFNCGKAVGHAHLGDAPAIALERRNRDALDKRFDQFALQLPRAESSCALSRASSDSADRRCAVAL